VKKYRTATDKRLVITADACWEELVELGEQSSFSAYPFQKWSCLKSLDLHGAEKRQRKLGFG
jgi:hypothetical protein